MNNRAISVCFKDFYTRLVKHNMTPTCFQFGVLRNAPDGRRWRVGSHLRMTMVQGSARSNLNAPNPIVSAQSNTLNTLGVRASATDELTSSTGQQQQQEECVLSPCPCGVLVQHPLQQQSSSLPDRNFALNNNSSGMAPQVMITTTSPTRRAEILLARIPARVRNCTIHIYEHATSLSQ